MNQYAQTLFELVDHRLASSARRLCTLLPSEVAVAAPAAAGTSQEHLRQQVRAELDDLLRLILGAFDNVGGVLPDGVLGYVIKAIPDEGYEDEEFQEEEIDIAEDEADYTQMWSDFLSEKKRDPVG